MNRRTVVLVTGLIAVLGLLTSTGGLSATAADRGLQVTIADDDDAYLGFQQDAVTTNGTTNLTVTVANQFPTGTTLDTVEISVDGETRDAGPLDAGEDETVTFEFAECDDTIAVDASGTGVAVSLSRPVGCA